MKRSLNPMLADKWGERALSEGWTALPTLLVQNQGKLGLDALDFAIIAVLVSHWWSAERPAQPGRTLIASALGVQGTTVRRRLAQLEKRGLLTRTRRGSGGRGATNVYELGGLIEAIEGVARGSSTSSRAAKKVSPSEEIPVESAG